MADIQERIAQAKKEAEEMKALITKNREGKKDQDPKELTKGLPAQPKLALKPRRTLKGHLAKIYAMHWAEEKANLVSASQDGKLLVWDGLTTNKTHVFPLRSSWVMTCAYSTEGGMVACGGLDNICSIYSLRNKDTSSKPFKELNSHTGYLSCCRFVDEGRILTSSGDTRCILWDIEGSKEISEFADHTGDVMSVAINKNDKNVFISGGCDYFAKLWDIRTARCVSTFQGHDGDINAVTYFPNGNAFATGSDDTTCRLWDIRADRDLVSYSRDSSAGISSVAFSLSGRFLFSGYDDNNCVVWDSMKGELASHIAAHENRVSCLGVSADGMALCTGSWDSLLKVWA